MDRKFQGMGCTSFQEFKAAVLEELKNVPKHILKDLCLSMTKTVGQILNSRGGRTKY